jgi:flagellar hook-associated protein 1 FlgK
LDEEGINLMAYQKSYQAAARYFTALDEAVDIIINKMGLVGR